MMGLPQMAHLSITSSVGERRSDGRERHQTPFFSVVRPAPRGGLKLFKGLRLIRETRGLPPLWRKAGLIGSSSR